MEGLINSRIPFVYVYFGLQVSNYSFCGWMSNKKNRTLEYELFVFIWFFMVNFSKIIRIENIIEKAVDYLFGTVLFVFVVVRNLIVHFIVFILAVLWLLQSSLNENSENKICVNFFLHVFK